MRILKALSVVLIFGLLSSCKDGSKDNTETSASTSETTLYYGGDIITMEGEEAQYAEAVVRKGDYIVFVGALDDAKKQFKDAEHYNLNGATMLPAFLDGHGHMYMVGMASMLAIFSHLLTDRALTLIVL